MYAESGSELPYFTNYITLALTTYENILNLKVYIDFLG